jgi:7-keto-8-aminopelargonate synthetase-like enzyme
MAIQFKPTCDDPRILSRALFHQPFNPALNFAIEDPLLLSTHKAVQEQGRAFARYYCSNSPLSLKAPQYVKEKLTLEEAFSKKVGSEKSLILSYVDLPLEWIKKSFLPSQTFFLPDSCPSSFTPPSTAFFSQKDLSSLIPLCKGLDQPPIVFIPKISQEGGRVDFSLLTQIKKMYPFFLIVEDSHTFGLEGFEGFAPNHEIACVDLLITHIPKTFGKMLTILSGSYELLDKLIEFSFSSLKFTPEAPYLGMLKTSLELVSSMQDRRDQIRSFTTKLKGISLPQMSITSPLITLTPSSHEEKNLWAKYLTDHGFLLPSSSFKGEDSALTFHIHHLLSETSIHFLQELISFSEKQIKVTSI